jgi:hypothetical protein
MFLCASITETPPPHVRRQAPPSLLLRAEDVGDMAVGRVNLLPLFLSGDDTSTDR